MSDSTETGDHKKNTSGGKTLRLSRTVGAGSVRQNISRGRTKSVVVERKRKRTIKSGGGSAEPETVQPVAKKKAVPPAARTRPSPEPSEKNKRQEMQSGMVLRTLTDDERDARGRALEEARVREIEDRARAEQEAREKAKEEEKRQKEQAEAEARAKEEADRLRLEGEALQKPDESSRRRAESRQKPAPVTEEKIEHPTGKETKTPARRRAETPPANKPSSRNKTGAGRRQGRLTISQALDGNAGERQRSLAAMRRRVEREKKKASEAAMEPRAKVARDVVIPEAITVQELANRMAERAVDVIKLLMQQGMMVKITDVLDADTAELVTGEMGHIVRRVSEADVEEGLVADDDPDETKEPRAPVVTVMGHVDHGKTSLLDALRQTDVAAGEAGGITQHIGACQVHMPSGDKITFLDTPGHAAFTAMRARGARATDLVILVVAGDDGVMPQTTEAVNHARAANVPMIVAINKMDKTGADATRVKNELLQQDVILEEFGGDVQAVEISATARTGLEALEEAILLQAEILDLKANPVRAAEGIIVEAKLDRGRGNVATVLVQRGTLNVGDIVVAGSEWGRVRALVDERGAHIAHAGPSVPVEILGLNGTPEAGDVFVVVENEARAREVTEYRTRVRRDKRVTGTARTTLDQMLSRLKDTDRKEVSVLVKTDVQGSAEAIVQALQKLGNEEVSARIIHAAVGGITESDVTLAQASKAPIIGFNVRANAQASDAAREAEIEIRYYSVIYNLVEDIKAAMSGMLSPELRETFLGNAEILEIFSISGVGKVAGCRVSDGSVQRGAKVRLIRDSVVIHEGTLSTLKRFKDEVKKVNNGQECGMAFENYQDIRQGDVIECFSVEEISRSLD